MKNIIIRGTTPTLVYKFKEVDVSTITEAYLNIAGAGALEKDLDDATVGEDTIAWTLTQAETLAMTGGVVSQINWKTSDGTRGASEQEYIETLANMKNEVI